MKHIRKIFAIIITLIVVGITAWLIAQNFPESVWGIIESVGAVLGLILVMVELRESRDLSEGTFVSSLTDSFNNNEHIYALYKKLELGEKITDDSIIDIVSYLTYFETIYVLLKKNAVDLMLIDDLFSYRFILALKNPTIQRISLVRHDSAYVNLYRLEYLWCKYKKRKSVLQEVNPNNYPIILRGNKMKKNDVILMAAKQSDAKEIYDVMREVYERLDDKTLYVCDDFEYVKRHIASKGFAIVARNRDDKIIGSFIIRFPELSADNLGRDIDLGEEELEKVVHMESAVVLPEYRGRDLQFKMLQYAEKLIDTDKYKYFMATVSPDNPASYKSFEKNGYESVLTKEKYKGLTRRIYLKKV